MSGVTRSSAAHRDEFDQPSGASFAGEERVEMMLAAASQEASEGLAAMLAILEVRHKRRTGGELDVEQFS